MKRRLASFAAIVVAGTLMPMAAAQAATTWCDPHSNEYAGTCFTIGTVASHVTVVESVPLINGSSKTGSFSCTFTKTITKAYTVGGSVTAEAKVGIFGLVDSKVSATVNTSMTQTGAQATAASATFTLAPHQQVTCQRIYSYVTTTATESEYRGTTVYKTSHSVTVPSTFGIRVVD